VSNELKLSADLRDLPFAIAFGQTVRAKATGVLELHDSIGLNRAFFLEGRPQGATLSRLKNPMGRILIEQDLITEHQLDEALVIHNQTAKLLGQVLLEKGWVSDSGLKQVMEIQSRLNCLSLFGIKEGRLEFNNGLVHLTDFTPSPMSSLMTLYEGVRDHGAYAVTYPLLAQLAFNAISLSENAAGFLEQLPPAEQMAARLLETFRFTGDLARSVPLAPASLGSLLFALNELGGLNIAPAIQVPRGT